MWPIADQNGIAATHVFGVHHDCANVLLVADMLKNRGSQLVALQQVEEHVHRRESAVCRNRVDRPTDVLVKGDVTDSADLDGLPFHGDAVTAIGAVDVDVLGDSRAGLRILQSSSALSGPPDIAQLGSRADRVVAPGRYGYVSSVMSHPSARPASTMSRNSGARPRLTPKFIVACVKWSAQPVPRESSIISAYASSAPAP